jgi:uncharacterized membrane protein
MARLSRPIVGLTFAACLAAGSRVAAQPLTTIDVPGAVSTSARSINARGQVVGFYLTRAQFPHASGFLWIDGAVTPIAIPGAVGTMPAGINDRGQIVGTYELPGDPGNDPRKLRGFVLDGSRFQPVLVPGSVGTTINGVNNRGDVVGEYYASGPQGAVGGHHGFVLSRGTFTEVAVPGAIVTQPMAIDENGRITGVFVTSVAGGGVRTGAFLFDGRSYTTFDLPPGGTPYAFGSHGEIYGTTGVGLVGDTHGFRFVNGVVTTFDVGPGPGHTAVFGINQRGQIVGAYVSDGGTGHGFVLAD